MGIAIIAYLLPRDNFKYDFELNKPWAYEDLIAPYPFPIQKLPAEIESEKQKIREAALPCYRLDTTILNRKLFEFKQAFGQMYTQKYKNDTILNFTNYDSLFHHEKGVELLQTIYKKGIIKPENIQIQQTNEQGEKQPIKQNIVPKNNLQLIDGNVSKKHKFSDFSTSITAFEFVLKKLTTDTRMKPNIVSDILYPILEKLEENIKYDPEITNKLLEEKLKNVLPIRDKIQEGERIVSNGQLVDNTIYQKLLSFKNTNEEQSRGFMDDLLSYLGYAVITSLLLGLLLFFIQFFKYDLYNNLRILSFVIFILVFFLFLLRSLIELGGDNVLYAIPYCIVPILLRTFLGNILAFLVYIILLLLCTFLVPGQYDFILLQFIAGTVALLSNINTSKWSQFFTSVSLIFLAYSVGYLGLHLIKTGSFNEIDYRIFGPFFLSSSLCLVAYPLIPLFEKMLGFISNLTLSELNNVNHPLLKALAAKAPGTFWHSIQVSSLAEQAALEIGANETLAKVGALYHDVGKLSNPLYFIENQNTEINPHDDLEPKESVQIILNHVTNGIELAKKHNLPNLLIDFIRTHHGTTKVDYFYKLYCKQNPEEKVDEKLFRYPGTMPYSKETAIVMLADSIEAASMSLNNPNTEQIDNLVDKIIGQKIGEKQFDNCNLSFKDIKIISKTFKKMLKSKYHIRIAY